VQIAETSNENIKRAEGWQFAVLFDKRFTGRHSAAESLMTAPA